jgi:hypothetical protein
MTASLRAASRRHLAVLLLVLLLGASGEAKCPGLDSLTDLDRAAVTTP